MKKSKGALSLILCSVFLFACSNHTHEAKTNWNYDKTYHWHSCNDEKCEELLNKEEHIFTWSLKSEANCLNAKEEIGSCVCGYTTTRNVDEALGHNWDEGTISDVISCGEEGTLTYTCLTCGAKKQETIQVSHTGNWSDWYNEVDATCSSKGQKSRTCLDCGAVESEETPINENNHFYGKWEITKEGNCTESGERQRKCIDCGHEEKETTLPNENVHNYVLNKVVKESTCGSKGSALYICSRCNDEKYFELDYKDNHSWSLDTLTGVSKCNDCGELIDKVTTINNKGLVIKNRYDLFLDGDFSLQYEFTSTDGGNANNWHNWCLLFLPGTYENNKLVSVELEKEEWGQSLAAVCPNGRFKKFIEEHNGKLESYIIDGKKVDGIEHTNSGALANGNWVVEVNRSGMKVTITANMVSSAHEVSFVVSFDMPTQIINLSLSGENNEVTVKSIKCSNTTFALKESNKVGQELLDNTIKFENVGGRQQKGYTVSLAKGDFDVEYQFVNHGGTSSDWHNFYYNFYAGVTNTGLDSDNVLWAFAANNCEPDWGYTFDSNHLRGTTDRAGYGWNYKYLDITSMINATCFVRITRINGTISVTGHAYNQNGAMITSFCFVGARTYDDVISMRLMSENSSIDLNSIKLYSGSLA